MIATPISQVITPIRSASMKLTMIAVGPIRRSAIWYSFGLNGFASLVHGYRIDFTAGSHTAESAAVNQASKAMSEKNEIAVYVNMISPYGFDFRYQIFRMWLVY